MNKLILVESPTKAKKIQKYFNDGTIVKSSFGHIMDLDKKTLSINVSDNFKPSYKIIPGKEKIIKDILHYRNDYQVILAADDDREGDSIAWHCGNLMKLDYNQKNRIIFHEISKDSILDSLQNIHKLNLNSVNSQQARRIIDRLVGFSLSPLLWKHIQTDKKGLSAGRVQSTLLSMLKDHEDKINNYIPQTITNCQGNFKSKKFSLSSEYISETSYQPEELCKQLQLNIHFKIKDILTYNGKEYPPKPFITSTLQRTAQKSLGFSIRKTMDIAQKLFENGKITYMRTDSTCVSKIFQKKLSYYISENYTREVYQPSLTKKVKGAQDAHECIRITQLDHTLNDKYTKDDHKLYNLIKENTICSHMKPAEINTLHIQLDTTIIQPNYFLGKHKVYTYLGYLIYYKDKYKIESQLSIPKDTIFELQKATCKTEETNPPSYPNESMIVKSLEDSGIGRPSTYSSIISTLYNRNYTNTETIPSKNKEVLCYILKNNTISKELITIKTKPLKQRIILTDLGKQVLTYLLQHFSHMLNTDFTSRIETDLDLISTGDKDWIQVVKNVYDSFISIVTIQNQIHSKNKLSKDKISLGDFKGHKVTIQNGPFGLYISYNQKNISLKYYLQKHKKSKDSIKLSDIQELLEYPLHIGKFKGYPIVIVIGPYGKYIKYKNKNYKIKQKQTYTLEECISILS